MESIRRRVHDKHEQDQPPDPVRLVRLPRPRARGLRGGAAVLPRGHLQHRGLGLRHVEQERPQLEESLKAGITASGGAESGEKNKTFQLNSSLPASTF